MAAGALKIDPTVDLQSAGVKQQVVDTAGVDVSAPARSLAPAVSEHEYIVSSTVSANQKKSLPVDKFVSSTVLKNQKNSTPSDVFVSSTVAANMLKAFDPPSAPSASPAKVAPVAAVAAPAAAAAVTVAAVQRAAPPAKKSGFYKKPSSDDELCPVEEECEL